MKNYRIISTPEDLDEFINYLQSQKHDLVFYDIETDSYVPWTSVTTITYTYETSRSVTLVENIKKFEKGKEVSNKNRYYWLRR